MSRRTLFTGVCLLPKSSAMWMFTFDVMRVCVCAVLDHARRCTASGPVSSHLPGVLPRLHWCVGRSFVRRLQCQCWWFHGMGRAHHALHVSCDGADRQDLECGDKVILPPSAFREIQRLRLPLPLIFGIVKGRKKQPSAVPRRDGQVRLPPKQCCGVLEFSATEGKVFLPFWMMQNLLVREGGNVTLRTESKVQHL